MGDVELFIFIFVSLIFIDSNSMWVVLTSCCENKSCDSRWIVLLSVLSPLFPQSFKLCSVSFQSQWRMLHEIRNDTLAW